MDLNDNCNTALVQEVVNLKREKQILEIDNKRLERENNELILRIRFLKEGIYFKLMFVILVLDLLWMIYGIVILDEKTIIYGGLLTMYTIALMMLVVYYR